MREIKFRAWSKSSGCFSGAFSIHMSGMISDMIDAKIDKDSKLAISDAHWGENDLEVMQYTGLKDKNGVEIYEGDILNCFGDIAEVYYDSSCALWRYKYKNDGCKYLEILGTHSYEHFEVIGNIYEHSHLLDNN